MSSQGRIARLFVCILSAANLLSVSAFAADAATGAPATNATTAPTTNGTTLPTSSPTTSATGPTSHPFEARLRSPRATMRTLLSAVSEAKENPERIQDAVACLALGATPAAERDKRGALLAEELEVVIQEIGVKTDAMPETFEGDRYTFADKDGLKIEFARESDGRWLIDEATVAQIPAMYEQVRRAATTQVVMEAAANVPPEFASPRETMRTFLQAMTDKNMELAVQCLNTDDITAGARAQVGPQLAQKLKAVMDRKQYVLLQEIPDEPKGEVYVWLSEEAGRIEIKRQESPPERKGYWQFSKATVKSIERLHQIYSGKPLVRELEEREARAEPAFWDSPALWLRYYIPEHLKGVAPKGQLLYLEPYQWMGIPVIVGLGWLFRRLAMSALSLGARVFLRYREVGLDASFLRKRLTPLATLAMVGLWWYGLEILDLRLEVLEIVWPWFKLMAALVSVWAVYRAVDLVAAYALARLSAANGQPTLAPMLVPLVSLTLKLVVGAVGVVFMLKLFEWDVTAVLTGLGLSGLAFALAAQDTLKNFFGSLTLLMDRPFYVGDHVKIGGQEGIVEAVGFRSTRIRSFDDSVITVPNGELTTTRIDNYGVRRYRLFTTTIGVTYGTPPELLVAFREGIGELILKHPAVRKDTSNTGVFAWGPSSIDILLSVSFEVATRPEELEARERLILDVLRLARELGVNFAFPSRTIYMSRDSDEAVQQPPYRSTEEAAAVGRAAATGLSGKNVSSMGYGGRVLSDQLPKDARPSRV